MSELDKGLTDFIRNTLSLEDDVPINKLTFMTDLCPESLEMHKLISAIESRYNVSLDNINGRSYWDYSVGDITSVINH